MRRYVAMDETGPILCGKCHVTPERGFERDGQMWASCPICGQKDTIEYIGREAAEYRADKAIRDMLSGLQSSSIMTVKYPPERSYRWITG
jgi:uncharacterized Zn finger protein (UPF0148 family)